MKQFFHKIAAGFMALIVLLSTMSFTIDMHLCEDELVDTAIFSEVESCGMEMKNSTHSDCSAVDDDCCVEPGYTFKGIQELNTSVEHFTSNNRLFVVAFVQSYVQLFTTTLNKRVSNKNYSTLLLVKEIHKLDETYLI